MADKYEKRVRDFHNPDPTKFKVVIRREGPFLMDLQVYNWKKRRRAKMKRIKELHDKAEEAEVTLRQIVRGLFSSEEK